MPSDPAGVEPPARGPKASRPVLLVEDESNDVLFFKKALAKDPSPFPVEIHSDGDAAWRYLSGSGPTPGPDRPSLIVLDLKLPKRSGLELLSSIKADSGLRTIPVIVLTSSKIQRDIDAAYALGADFYLVKGLDFARTQAMVEAVHAFWTALEGNPDAAGADPSLSPLRKMAEIGGPERSAAKQ